MNKSCYSIPVTGLRSDKRDNPMEAKMLPCGRYDRLGRVNIHVSPDGADFGDGTVGYPVQTLGQAVALVRNTRKIAHNHTTQSAVIWLHEGTHRLAEPLQLNVEDSNLTVAAWPEAIAPVKVSGATDVSHWQIDEVNGETVWVSSLPHGAGSSLFVNVERLAKPRFPSAGLLRIQGQEGIDPAAPMLPQLFSGTDTFQISPAELPQIDNPEDCHVVVPHFWLQERLPLKSIDINTGTVTVKYRSMLSLMDGTNDQFAGYFLDGVSSELGKTPGQWLVDRQGQIPTANRPEGYAVPVVFYVPQAGQNVAEFVAQMPTTKAFAMVAGTADAPVQNLHFEGIAFEYFDEADFSPSYAPFQMREDPILDPEIPFASDPQGASKAPGMLTIKHAQGVHISDCSFKRIGGYAIRFEAGCRYSSVSYCNFDDLGAGGISCGGGHSLGQPDTTSDIDITDNVITNGGHIYGHCSAILLRHAAGISVTHNEISYFPQTAIAVGWRWDYGVSPAINNVIANNHLHHLGRGETDWFGAIYTLGISPGTQLTQNFIHHVRAASFGGWGILLDPASAHITVSENVIVETSHESLHIKSGRENIVRGNILAAPGGGCISLAVPEAQVAATAINNVFFPASNVAGEGQQRESLGAAFVGAPGSAPIHQIVSLKSDANMLVVPSGEEPLWAADLESTGAVNQNGLWHEAGNDNHSVLEALPAGATEFLAGQEDFFVPDFVTGTVHIGQKLRSEFSHLPDVIHAGPRGSRGESYGPMAVTDSEASSTQFRKTQVSPEGIMA